MKNLNQLETYHKLFMLVVQNSRIMPKGIQKELNYYGRGHARSTLLYHLQNMYKKKISLRPQLKIHPFTNLKKTAYFCRKIDQVDIYETFLKLHLNKDVSFVELLSGADFFITSFRDDVDFGIDSLMTIEKHTFFRSIYTIPGGWNKDHKECFETLLNGKFWKERIDRTIEGTLNWTETDWKIYFHMRLDVRCKFTSVGNYAGIDSKTAKKHYHENVLPKCDIAHYFFPKGHDYYRELFFKIRTGYEVSLVKALKNLPCTTYIYPLEDAIVTVIFQDDEKHVISIFQKLKEIGIINDYLFYTPIIHGIKE